jgi:hypothetical protein
MTEYGDKYSDDQLIAKHQEIKRKVEDLNAKHKEVIAPLNASLELIKNVLLQRLNTRSPDLTKPASTKTAFGTAYRIREMDLKITDRGLALKFCLENWTTFGSDMLQIGLSKPEVSEYIEQHETKSPPPGCEITRFISVGVRKA